MAEEQDKTHRLLFSFPRMIEDLIRLCLGGEWVERLDFKSLEKVPERLLSPELVRREQDVLWRLRYHPSDDPKEEDWFYVYLHIEHQSSPRKRMALDTTAYKLLALQDLARRGELTRRRKLPTIFTLVFYTGEAGWHAPTSLLDLIEEVPGAPEGVDLWSYVLVDAHRQPLEELLGSDSPLVGLFRLERLEDPKELSGVALELDRVLDRPEDQGLAEAFVALINEGVLVKLSPADGERVRISGLKEVPTMLAQRMERITKGWEMQGWEKGRQEGRQEGRKAATARLFLQLFETKFGDAPVGVCERVATASEAKLETWAKRLLVAERPEDVFED